MTAMVSPIRIAQVMCLNRKVRSLSELSAVVNQGLPKSALNARVARVFSEGPESTDILYRVIPDATYKRRRDHLKPEENEHTERLARVIATAEYVWDDQKEAPRLLKSPHAQVGGLRPIEVALTELGARRVEALLWKLLYGIAA